ncbi:hypothetical protein GIB67_002707 [Kingdonia uniflora]|uniref:Uncharacterized protein n=1 Tax=Kingdonia uniflora TaxID=39325 RepID=A0A7J7LJN8_9MAGN|nr:hypothetical protein GIB67_002707 [Kingdonia uniflora]
MALLPSSFQGRLQKMEETRNQRLSLLQAEKELQSKKSQLVNEKLSNIRSMEQRCFMLEQINASLNFKILGYKSEFERIGVNYQKDAQQFRDLKCEVEEIEEREKEKDGYYEMKRLEMEEFKEHVRRCVCEYRQKVGKTRKIIDELKSSLKEFQSKDEYMNNSEIAVEEARKAEFLLMKANLDKSLASNYRLQTQLQKQLYQILMSQEQERRNLNQSS